MKPLHTIVRCGVLALAACLTSCIDEDRSDCPPPGPAEHTINILYEVALEGASDEFTGTLRDLHAGFWSEPASLTWHKCIPQAEMPGNRYTITLPADNYRHVAVANYPTDGCMADDSPCAGVITDSELRLKEDGKGNVRAIYNEIYTGRLPILVDGTGGTYHVPLYPCVGKVRIHAKHPASFGNVRCYMEDVAVCHTPDDNGYEFDAGVTVDLNDGAHCQHGPLQSDFECFSFPCGGEPKPVPAAGLRQTAGRTYYWKAVFLVDVDGRTDRYTYYVDTQKVEAGQLTEITFDLGNVDASAGVVIDIDWKPGSEFNPEV